VKKGYKLMEVHDVYEYQVTNYDPQTGNDRLFAEYINTILKLKAEASAYPNCVKCPEDEDRYISEFNNSEGDQLDKDAIGPKPSRHVMAKLCLNSMWGKLTE
jgi:hypothetical protein